MAIEGRTEMLSFDLANWFEWKRYFQLNIYFRFGRRYLFADCLPIAKCVQVEKKRKVPISSLMFVFMHSEA